MGWWWSSARGGEADDGAVASPSHERAPSGSSDHDLLLLREDAENSAGDDRSAAIFVKENIPILASFFLFVFASCAFMSVLTPFLPLELAKAGASPAFTGWVFAAYPFANLLAVPLSTRACQSLGRSTAFVLGGVTEAALGITLGYVHMLSSPQLQKWLYLGVRIVQGCGASVGYTALMAFVSERFAARLEAVYGWQEAVGGLGFMLGPPIGGVLFRLAGMSLPFLVLAGVVLTTLTPLSWAIASAQEARAEESESIAGTSAAGSHKSAAALAGRDRALRPKASQLVNLSTVNASVVTILAGIGFGFLSPVAAPHFQDVLNPDLKEDAIGLILSLPAFLYAVFSPLSGLMCERWGNKRVMFLGMALLGACYALFGPWPLLANALRIHRRTRGMWADQIVSMALLGIGAAAAIVPALPDMQKSVRRLGYGAGATEAVASYFNGIYCLGEGLGPLVAGLSGVVSIQDMCTVVAAGFFAYTTVVLYWKLTKSLCRSSAPGRPQGDGESGAQNRPLLRSGDLDEFA